MKLWFLVMLATGLAAGESPQAAPQPAPQVASAALQPGKPVTFAITHSESTKPQVVRILYLDEGTREIILPPAPVTTAESPKPPDQPPPDQPQVVLILNSEDGAQVVVLPPAAPAAH